MGTSAVLEVTCTRHTIRSLGRCYLTTLHERLAKHALQGWIFTPAQRFGALVARLVSICVCLFAQHGSDVALEQRTLGHVESANVGTHHNQAIVRTVHDGNLPRRHAAVQQRFRQRVFHDGRHRAPQRPRAVRLQHSCTISMSTMCAHACVPEPGTKALA